MKTDPRTLALDFLKKSRKKNLGYLMQDCSVLSGLGKRDVSFCFNLVNETLRNMNYIDFVLSAYLPRFSKLPPSVVWILRMGTSQILFFSSVPDYAAIDSSVELAKKSGKTAFSGLINAVLRKISLSRVFMPEGDSPAELSIRHSIPEWLIEKWMSNFGVKRTILILNFFSQKSRLCLRAEDQSRISSLEEEIKKEGYTFKKAVYSKKAFYSDHDIISSRFFSEGRITVQDESSILSCEVFDVPFSESCVDLCAAPGGKAGILARRSTFIAACDINRKKIKLMSENFRRLGLEKDIFPCVCDSAKPPFAGESINIAVADVPCSGTGTLRKNPDLRLKLKPEYIFSRINLQLEILESASFMLKKGGFILYSTCSLEREENSGVVSSFLKNNSGFRVVEPKNEYSCFSDRNGFVNFFPDLHGTEGGFAALLEKKTED